MHRRGMTLFELLVVVVFLALLIAILIPTLGRVNTRPTRLICGTNLKLLGNAFATYAMSYDGHWPSSATPLGSLCEQSLETRDALFKMTTTSVSTPPETHQKRFYCPANTAQNPAKLWTHAGVSTWGYAWMNDRGTAGAALPSAFPPRKTPLRYISSLLGQPDAATAILAADLIVTDTPAPPLNYTPKPKSVTFGSNHLSGKTVTGANLLLADGSVRWTPFNPNDATPVQQPRGDFFWFPNP